MWDNPGNLYTDQILDEDDKELMLFEGVVRIVFCFC